MDPESTKRGDKFPVGLLSPQYYRGDAGRSWALVSFGLQKPPDWTADIIHSIKRICFYREIIYLTSNGEVEGLGRSWSPISRLGVKIQLKSLRPWNPLPLGVALEVVMRNDFSVEVISEADASKVLNPYRIGVERILMYRRAIKQSSTNKYIAFTEEDILSSRAK